MTCGFGCGAFSFSRPRPAGDEWDLWSLPLDLSLLPYEILPAAFTSSFRLLPSCFWIGVPKVLPFLRPFCRLGKICFKMSICSRWDFAKDFLESGFAWSSYLLISGCFLSVTILYHSLGISSIRRPHKVIVQYLCIFWIDLHISKVV